MLSLDVSLSYCECMIIWFISFTHFGIALSAYDYNYCFRFTMSYLFFFLASTCLSYELLVFIILSISLLTGIGYFVLYDFSI
jgi:hypothetical protein